MEQSRLPPPRRLPFGAEPGPDGGTSFRVWAPRRRQLEVVLERPASGGAPAPSGPGDGSRAIGSVRLEREEDGWFSGHARDVAAGALYRLRHDGSSALFPDPASRFQPEGVHGPSMVVDPDAFVWRGGTGGAPAPGTSVIYEMHVGTFTAEGRWASAAEAIGPLADLGINVLEVMPVAEFPGRFGWGYDGVYPFAPFHHYGAPDDFRRFVDRAHALGIAVILNVVYNHLGPDGSYIRELTDDFFSRRHVTDWGDAINFDGSGCGPVRELYLANAEHWIREYRLDGFRFDALQDIHDDSDPSIIAEIARRARVAADGRRLLLVGENEPQDTKLLRPIDRGGCGLDALWNDDLHHSAVVALTGREDAYYTDYLGTPQELVSAAKHGFLYQGQHYAWQGKRRGSATRGVPRHAFVAFIENHDQVANSERGARVHQLAAPGAWRAITAYLILAGGTPMLFQGQEFACSAPFLFFADLPPDLAPAVRRGRTEFLAQFRTLALPEVQAALADPADPRTFERCRLDRSELEGDDGAPHREALALHRDLLRLRREDEVLSGDADLDGAVLGTDALVLRFFEDTGADRLLLVNLGRDLRFSPAPEPLLAPPAERSWGVLWSSESPSYGGRGTPPPERDGAWWIPGRCAIVLAPEPRTEQGGPGAGPRRRRTDR